MKLDKIGFYTLTEERAKTTSSISPIIRAELLLTDKCNLKCPYCRGMKNEGELPLSYVKKILNSLYKEKLTNIRFSGGEPTLYPYLKELIKNCKENNVKRIAISTNGTADLKLYKELIELGVNDFSISLYSGCCSLGEKMTGGIKDSWNKAVDTIKYVSKYSYTTVGVVFNELNYKKAIETIRFINNLKVSDIRVIPSAQYNKALNSLSLLSTKIRSLYPILNYRLNNLTKNINFRGIKKSDCHKCWLVLDDIAISGQYQYPCIIYLRESGNPISIMDEDFRARRFEWFKKHNSYEDNICKNQCLDVCLSYNNKVNYYVRKNARNLL